MKDELLIYVRYELMISGKLVVPSGSQANALTAMVGNQVGHRPKIVPALIAKSLAGDLSP